MSVKKFDFSVTPDDLWQIIHGHIIENGLSRDAIDSMNDFYDIGIPQIMTKVFNIEHVINNTRDKTPQDRQIEKIRFRILLNNIRLKNPVTSGYCSGQERILFPLQASLEDRTYSSNMFVDATIDAWAYTKDGQEQHRTATVDNFRLASIPAMVGSKLCNTYGKSLGTLEQMREDPKDPRAYFVKSGREWSVDNVESVAYNQDRIFNNYWRTELQRLEFISKPGDTYQNSKQVIIRLLSNDCLTVGIGSQNLRDVQFPFYMVFRALGWSTDKQMLDNILYQSVGYPDEKRNDDVLTEKMYDLLRRALFADYDTKAHKFGNPVSIHSQTDVLSYLVRHMPKEVFKDMDLNKDEHLHQAITDLLSRFDDDFLPHIGQDESSRNAKLRYFGMLIRKMILVNMELLSQTDRDSYVIKRVHPPGVSMAKIFKTHYGTITSHASKQLTKDFRNMSFQSVNLMQAFRISFNGADLERLMMQSITSGNQATLKVNKYRTIINRLSSQLVDRKNYTKILSTIRMIISPSGDSSKGSDRAKEMRMPHLSFQGFACLIQSPEGGDKVGLHKQMAISASICSYGSSELLKKTLLADSKRVTPLAEVQPFEMATMRPVLVNGDWIGCTRDTWDLVTHNVNERRALRIDKNATIQWDNESDVVQFWVDYGRIRRPLTIVYNNVRDWKFLGLAEPAKYDKFEQHILLTREHLQQLREGKLHLDDLLRLQIIEYVTPGEQIRLDVACDLNHLKEHRTDPLRWFTHCDINEAMFGIAALTGPLANYNQTPRNTFQTSQVRQTGAHYAYNWAYRIDKDTFLQYQVGRPIVQTRINRYIPDHGDTAVVAVSCYSGYNEEDSLVFNKTTGERLKFAGCWFTYEKVELEKNETFANPDLSRTTGIKKYANYSKLGKNGIVPEGTVVKKGDVIVGKVKRLPKNIAAEKKVEFSDQSLVYKMEFPSVVHNVVIAKDDEATTFCKVAFKSLKPVIIGDCISQSLGY